MKMPYRFWKIPDHKLWRVGYFAAVAVILIAATYSILSIFCGFYIVDGEDLADGRPWRRYAIILKSHWQKSEICPDLRNCGLTLFFCYRKPAAAYQYYQLNDPRHSFRDFCGCIISFWGETIVNWDTFGWDEYYGLQEKLNSKQLPVTQAKLLHKKMIDICHSGLDKDGRRDATHKLLKEFTAADTTPSP